MAHDHARIEQLAYQLWESRGRRDGSAHEDWLEAERQATRASQSPAVDESSQESFPASDPPASHLPDLPPANADDKWATAQGDVAVRSR